MATIGRREQNKAAKRARILTAASNLFAEHGYAATTTQQVAEAADVATGTIFSYAATKPELLLLVMNERWVVDIERGVRAAGQIDQPLPAILALLTPLVKMARADRETFVVLVGEVIFGSGGEHRQRSLVLVAELVGAIAGILQRHPGYRSEVDPMAAGRAVLSTVLFEMNRVRIGVAEANLDGITEQIRIILAGVIR